LLLRRYRHLDMMPAIAFGGFLAFVGAGFAPLIGNLFSLTAEPLPAGFSVGLRDMVLLFLMGPVQLSIPLVFYARGARNVAAVTLAILSMLDAILNPLWPWIFVNEVPGRASIIGGSIILVAVALGVLGGHVHGYARRMSTR
jgi:drug/metabolite transporter (DMT)-like permease